MAAGLAPGSSAAAGLEQSTGHWREGSGCSRGTGSGGGLQGTLGRQQSPLPPHRAGSAPPRQPWADSGPGCAGVSGIVQ